MALRAEYGFREGTGTSSASETAGRPAYVVDGVWGVGKTGNGVATPTGSAARSAGGLPTGVWVNPTRSNTWTIMCWAKVLALPSSGTSWNEILGFEGEPGENFYVEYGRSGATYSIAFGAQGTGGSWTLSGGASPLTFDPTAWHHIAAVRNGNTITIYCDGVLTATNTGSLGSLTTLHELSLYNAYTSNTGDSRQIIDDIRMFDTAESAASITTWMNTPIEAGGLVANPADAAGITDAAARVLAAGRTQADLEGVTDAVTLAVAAVRATGDPVGATDSVVATTGRTAFLVDPVSVADVAAADLARPSTVGDGLTVGDVVAAITAASRSLPDSVGVTDTVAATLGGATSLADGVGVADATARTIAADRPDDDPTGVTDTVTTTLSTARSASDPVGISDTATASVTSAGEASASDPVGIVDAVSVVMSRVRTVADFLAIVDSPVAGTGAAASKADPVGLADDVARWLSLDRPTADGEGITDTASSTRGWARGPAEPVGLGDTATATLTRVVTVALDDVVGIADLTASTTVLPEDPPTIFTLTALATAFTLEALTPVLTLTPEEP